MKLCQNQLKHNHRKQGHYQIQKENLAVAETVLNQLLQQSSFIDDNLVGLMLTPRRLPVVPGQEDVARLWFIARHQAQDFLFPKLQSY